MIDRIQDVLTRMLAGETRAVASLNSSSASSAASSMSPCIATRSTRANGASRGLGDVTNGARTSRQQHLLMSPSSMSDIITITQSPAALSDGSPFAEEEQHSPPRRRRQAAPV
jgi:hypothetical protein